jgi:hypothetical protein
LRRLAVVLVFMSGLLPLVQGQTYSQPMLGVSWDRHELYVHIPSSPSWAHSAIDAAIDDWNNAQLWFIHTYFPNQNGTEFSLVGVEKNTKPQVTIVYVADSGQVWSGSTEIPAAGMISNETMLLVLSRLQTPDDLTQVMEHELGHVLGLDHTQILTDLMSASQDAYTGGELSHPSTLNLYGVYLLGRGCTFTAGDAVTLPAQIPYLEWYPAIQQPTASAPQNVVPNTSCPSQTSFWNQPSFIFALAAGSVILVTVILLSRRKKQPRPSRFME